MFSDNIHKQIVKFANKGEGLLLTQPFRDRGVANRIHE
jgi:hypothetical protein